MRNRATVRERSGKAAPKPRGSNAKKRARSPAESAAEPGDAQDAAAADKKKFKREPVFGATFMLFRIICVATFVTGAAVVSASESLYT